MTHTTKISHVSLVKRVPRKASRIRIAQFQLLCIYMDDLKADLKVEFSFIYFVQSLLSQERNAINITNTN